MPTLTLSAIFSNESVKSNWLTGMDPFVWFRFVADAGGQSVSTSGQFATPQESVTAAPPNRCSLAGIEGTKNDSFHMHKVC